jgi:hypothetical protein
MVTVMMSPFGMVSMMASPYSPPIASGVIRGICSNTAFKISFTSRTTDFVNPNIITKTNIKITKRGKIDTRKCMTAYFTGFVQAIARKKVVVKLGLLVQTCPIIDSGHHKPIE